MAESIIKKPSLNAKIVSLPFTPTKDGLLITYLRAEAQGRVYETYANTSPGIADGYQTALGYVCCVQTVSSGAEVRVTNSINVRQSSHIFVSQN